MEGCPTRGRELILLRCGATSVLSRGAYLAACWLHEPQPVNEIQLGWGLQTMRGATDPGDLRTPSRVVGVVEIWKYL